jgi:TPR repeat protein
MTAANPAWSRHSRMIATAWFRPIILSCALTLGTGGTGAAALSSEQASQAGRDVVRPRVLPTPADVNRLSEAAEHGDAAAMNDLGELYANGRGVPKDVARAFQWFQKAAEHGLAKAEFNEGEAYARGDGVPPDSGRPSNGIAKQRYTDFRRRNSRLQRPTPRAMALGAMMCSLISGI